VRRCVHDVRDADEHVVGDADLDLDLDLDTAPGHVVGDADGARAEPASSQRVSTDPRLAAHRRFRGPGAPAPRASLSLSCLSCRYCVTY